MDPNWKPLERAKTYELVVRQIKSEIFAGRLRPGDHLPGERQLSELLGVSRPSVREAIRILQSLEVVQSRPGTGANSGLVVATQPSKALEDLLELHVALASYSTSDVVGVRLILECQVARELIKQGDKLHDAEEILHQLSHPNLSKNDFQALDSEFHLTLARRTGNDFLADLMVAIRESVRRVMDTVFEADGVWPEQRERYVQEHVNILTAIQNRDESRAIDLIQDHIGGFLKNLPKLNSTGNATN